jgi:hypothetical protein
MIKKSLISQDASHTEENQEKLLMNTLKKISGAATAARSGVRC